MAVIAPKARIRAPGKASANLLAAPSSVDPRVIMSSTKRISVGGGPDIRRWTLRLAICSLGFGLSDGLLHADFFTAVTRTRHESTCLPNPLFAKAVCSLALGSFWVPERELCLDERNMQRVSFPYFVGSPWLSIPTLAWEGF